MVKADKQKGIADFDNMINRMRALIDKHRQTIDDSTVAIAALNVAINQTQINKQDYMDAYTEQNNDGVEHIIPYKQEEQNNE